ncbi:signal recognition particle protein [Paenibacillus psychroresistens]|uniref:Signal recognition particle protein n=1 Tax=Paenibacillus psychroresistens TaxID=1778678 RepID=A0A6B8RLF8_9BACL|nr:signal recognition particle protein [Paenibacillus psychroresistens]QGQ96198.1 signal recognition particle protein [Paenibacillus psychroresistens]
MAFEGLASRLQNVFSKLKGKGRLSEEDVNEALREVRLALLEADVNFKVVKDFIAKIREKAVGLDVTKSFTPGMLVIDIVNKELTALMGETQSKLARSNKPPTVIMMVGLQGAGKTTTTGKLAKLLQKQNHRPLLVAGDIYRPAAIKQLQVLGEQIKVPVFTLGDQVSPVAIAKAGLQHAKDNGHDYLIIDTAGRLHIDEELMEELANIRKEVDPDEILLVIDAMTGQDAVNVADNFNKQLELTGVILTKLDGDTRGGAALSVRAVTGCPIKFVATGEKVDALEPFYPDRMASRILGMGDMLSLIEKAQENIDADKAKELELKMRNNEFTFEDFLEQLEQVKKLGPLDQLLDMMPGMNKLKGAKDLKVDDKQMARTVAIVKSMTTQEKRKPEILNASRRKRLALGSGTSVQEVNRLIKQFDDMRKMMKQFSGMMGSGGKGMKGLKGKLGKGMKFPFG